MRGAISTKWRFSGLLVVECRRSVIAAYSLLIKDLGPNGTGATSGCDPNCGDGDEKVFLRQGVFTP